MSDPLDHMGELINKLHATAIDPSMFGAILDCLPDGVIVINDDGRIRFVNQAIENMFHYHRSKLIGQSVHMLLDPSLAAPHAGHLKRYFRAPGSRPMNSAKPLPGRRSDGEPIEVVISINAKMLEGGMIGVAVVRPVVIGA